MKRPDVPKVVIGYWTLSQTSFVRGTSHNVQAEAEISIPLGHLDVIIPTTTELEASGSFSDSHWIGRSQWGGKNESSWRIGASIIPNDEAQTQLDHSGGSARTMSVIDEPCDQPSVSGGLQPHHDWVWFYSVSDETIYCKGAIHRTSFI